MARKHVREEDNVVEELFGHLGSGERTNDEDDDTAHADDPVTVSGNVRRWERDALRELADEIGITQSKAVRFAIRFLLREYRAGRVTFEYETRDVKMPE